jgi:hypothetical protein
VCSEHGPAQAASYVQQIPGLGLAGHLNRDALADAKPLAAASTDYRIWSPRPGGCTSTSSPTPHQQRSSPRCLARLRCWDVRGWATPYPSVRLGRAAVVPRLSA